MSISARVDFGRACVSAADVAEPAQEELDRRVDAEGLQDARGGERENGEGHAGTGEELQQGTYTPRAPPPPPPHGPPPTPT